jgi:hypothetical protein
MRSKIAAVVLVLIGSALAFGLNTTTAAAASIGDHSDAAAALPLGLTGSVGSAAVLLGLVGMAFGLITRARGMKAAKRAAEARKTTGKPSAKAGVAPTATSAVTSAVASAVGKPGVPGEATSAA